MLDEVHATSGGPLGPHENFPGLLVTQADEIQTKSKVMMARARKPSSSVSNSLDDAGFFEGAEKLLEVWFYLDPERSREPQLVEKKGLRVIPRYVVSAPDPFL